MFQFDSSLPPHAMSEARHGSMSFRYVPHPEVARTNRLAFFRQLWEQPGGYPLFMPGNGVSMRGSFVTPLKPEEEIRVVEWVDRGLGMFTPEDEVQAEALVTRDRSVFLFLTEADCLPVVLFDPVTETLALAHISRVTAVARDEDGRRVEPLLVRLVALLAEKLSVRPQDLVAAIGPGVSQSSYELDWFAGSSDPEWQPFIVYQDGKLFPDLARHSAWLLNERLGVPEAQLLVAGLDTVTARDEEGAYRFFSHIRTRVFGAPEGRNAFVVGMPAR